MLGDHRQRTKPKNSPPGTTGKMTLLLATTNPGKIGEIRDILKNLPLRIRALSEYSGQIVVKESGKTFAQNAKKKARVVGQRFNILTLADDSGLEVDALAGRPGVVSARFAPTDQGRIRRLLKELRGVPQNRRSARFKAVVAVFDPATGSTKTFSGESEGWITTVPKGKSGFGYDPVFYSKGLEKTFAQASVSEKNRVSHRAVAFRKAQKYLKEIIRSRWTASVVRNTKNDHSLRRTPKRRETDRTAREAKSAAAKDRSTPTT